MIVLFVLHYISILPLGRYRRRDHTFPTTDVTNKNVANRLDDCFVCSSNQMFVKLYCLFEISPLFSFFIVFLHTRKET